MGNRKSQALYTGLVEKVLQDVALSLGSEYPVKELKRDCKTIAQRSESEGLSFLTMALPLLGKALDLGLETGRLVVPPGFARMSKSRRVQNIPRLFGALFALIFDSDGCLCSCRPDVVAHIRQLTFLLYKLEVPFSAEQLQKSSERFIAVDEDCTGGNPSAASLRRVRWVVADVLSGFDPREMTPQHGPGAVADRLFGREKWRFLATVPHKLLECYGWNYTHQPHLNSTLDRVLKNATLEAVQPAKVVFVPKDSRGPRVISAEPSLLQYFQQGVGRALVAHIERSPYGRFIGFRDQTVNQRLAKQSSLDRRYATIDLKDASDRLSREVVRRVLPDRLFPYFDSIRSTAATLPNGSTRTLKKMAPMGNGYTFPLEALIFYSVCESVVRRRKDFSLHRPSGKCFVYGDDIIVPTEHVPAVVRELQAYGFVVNSDKSYVCGHFRESCGCDAYLGVDVTPVKIRCFASNGALSGLGDCLRLQENANAFFDRLYWSAAAYLDAVVDQHTKFCVPVLPPQISGLRRTSRVLPVRPQDVAVRWNSALQRVEWRVRKAVPTVRESPYPSEEMRLLNNLQRGLGEAYKPTVDVPGVIVIKPRWESV